MFIQTQVGPLPNARALFRIVSVPLLFFLMDQPLEDSEWERYQWYHSYLSRIVFAPTIDPSLRADNDPHLFMASFIRRYYIDLPRSDGYVIRQVHLLPWKAQVLSKAWHRVVDDELIAAYSDAGIRDHLVHVVRKLCGGAWLPGMSRLQFLCYDRCFSFF